MHASVGYSENPISGLAGKEAARQALKKAGRGGPCDFILLFATARHNPGELREAVVAVVGDVPVVGGGASGGISNDCFGYAGDQVILALFWLEGVQCHILSEGALTEGETDVGKRLGVRLKALAAAPDSPVILFYDTIDRTHGDMRLLMATPLMAGLKQGLGYFPNLVGAGLQGDFTNTPTPQWTGSGTGMHHALALYFAGDIQLDSAIMHGCRPATSYYTVTKADKQTVLEIDGEPALPFVVKALGMEPEALPLFLIFGVNRGDKWGPFNEENYANRLCLGIDKERNGLVMFEPDLVEGTELQIMYRTMEPDYIEPKIECVFQRAKHRKPVFALYIDCAGRAAGYGGGDLEDAAVVQKSVANRVPLMGIYTGVEIANVGGEPRGLDWTGVFCLFSTS